MLTIQALKFPDIGEYIVLRGDKGILLFRWDKETQEFSLVLEPVFCSCKIEDVAVEQVNLE